MFKSLIAFFLSRRAIVVFGLVFFAGAGLIAFKQLNIEAYPNPTPVILEITAQAPGLSAEEMGNVTTHAPRRLDSIPRPALTSSALPRSMACPSFASPSNMGWTITSPTPRPRSRSNSTLTCQAV